MLRECQVFKRQVYSSGKFLVLTQLYLGVALLRGFHLWTDTPYGWRLMHVVSTEVEQKVEVVMLAGEEIAQKSVLHALAKTKQRYLLIQLSVCLKEEDALTILLDY